MDPFLASTPSAGTNIILPALTIAALSGLRLAEVSRLDWREVRLVATLKDVPAVALEAGNSPNVIFSHYRAVLIEAEGRAWFAVLPPKAGNVVTIQSQELVR